MAGIKEDGSVVVVFVGQKTKAGMTEDLAVVVVGQKTKAGMTKD